MQNFLFEDDAPEPAAPAGKALRKPSDSRVSPAPHDPALVDQSARLPALLRLGTSSWNYPGWVGTVWAREYPEARLSRQGLAAYAKHPLLRSVSLDRGFYRALNVTQYAAYAAQVPEHFRFVVKAPSTVADAMVRAENGRGMQVNPDFLNPERAVREFVAPALEGLGARLGALVFQLSPIPPLMLQELPGLMHRLETMLRALPALRPQAPQGVIAVEVRNPEFLTPAFADLLRRCGATYCLGLHAKMPGIDAQLPMLRALWPGPLVCRWNLNPLHGAFGYEDAKKRYGNFDRILDADPDTRHALARVIVGTTRAGQPAYVTISNKAEGSAPLSVRALADAVCALQDRAP